MWIPPRRVSSRTTSSASSPCLARVCMEPAATEAVASGAAKRRKREVLKPTQEYRSYRIRLRTTPAQRRALREWFAGARWAYNRTVEGVRKEEFAPFETSCKHVMQDPARDRWRESTHSTVMKNASREAITAYRSNLAKATKKPFEVKFRSARNLTESIQLDGAQFDTLERHQAKRKNKVIATDDARFLKDTGPVMRILPLPEPTSSRPRAHVFLGKSMAPLGPVVIRDRNWIIDRLVEDRYLLNAARLILDRRHSGEMFLLACLPRGLQRAAEEPTRIVVMDPGVRRFQTFLDPDDGRHGVVLDHYHPQNNTVAAELLRRCHKVDAWQSRQYDAKRHRRIRERPTGESARCWERCAQRGDVSPRQHRRFCHREAHQARRRDRRHQRRELGRLAGFKDNMHYNAICFLFTHWDVVVVSLTSPGGLCERARRPFGSRTARAACAWNHYAFRQKLKSVGQRHGNKHVVEVGEAYTSRTCGLCGTLNHDLGGAKTFQCVDEHCGVQIDRDVNGARNMLLRELTRRWCSE